MVDYSIMPQYLEPQPAHGQDVYRTLGYEVAVMSISPLVELVGYSGRVRAHA